MKAPRCLHVAVGLVGLLAGSSFGAPPAAAGAAAASALEPHLRKTMSWTCPSLGEAFDVKIYFARPSTGAEAAEVILYVINDAWERIGREGDGSILRDMIDEGFIVVTLDFGHNGRAVSPAIDGEIGSSWCRRAAAWRPI